MVYTHPQHRDSKDSFLLNNSLFTTFIPSIPSESELAEWDEGNEFVNLYSLNCAWC